MKKIQHLMCALTMLTICFSCTKDSGNITVTYQEATAIYGDIDEVRQMPLNELSRTINNPGKIYIDEDFILIGEEGEGIHVINNKNRNNPFSESFIRIPGNREFIVVDGFLYAESYYDVVKINITNPSSAVLTDRAVNAIQESMTNDKGETLIGFSYQTKTIDINEDDDFFSEIIGDQLVYLDFAKNVIPNSAVPTSFAGNSQNQSGTVNRLALHKDNLYVISNHNFTVVSDKDTFGAFVTKQESAVEDMETIFSHEDHLFVGSRTSMSVFSSDATGRVRQVNSVTHATSCDPVLPHENVAYVTLRTGDFSECPGDVNAMLVLDISNMQSIDEIDDISMKSPYGMTVIGEQLYVGQGKNGMDVFDISNPRKPQLVLSDNIEAYDIIADPVNPNYIFIAGPDELSQYLIGDEQILDLQSQISF